MIDDVTRERNLKALHDPKKSKKFKINEFEFLKKLQTLFMTYSVVVVAAAVA